MNIFLFSIFCLFVAVAGEVRNVSQLIQDAGYPCENYWAKTSDGFLLSIQRIPNPGRPVVFLQHGLLDSANTWIMNPPKEGLGYIFYDSGFDVFLGNVRGNTYSSQNKRVSPDSTQFWDLVDFDNMAAIDLPTMVDFALQLTKKPSLTYVGHSQGTIMGFAGFPQNPQLTKKVNLFLALAPVAFVNHQKSPVLDVLKDLHIGVILELLGEKEFLPNDKLVQFFGGTLCDVEPLLCEDVIFLLCGNTNLTRMPIYIDHTPAGTSVRNMIHWAQAVRSGKFQKFDYGSAQKNMQHYNQTTPPQYSLAAFTAPPVALFTGGNDWLADPTDVQKLIQGLPTSNKPLKVVNIPEYQHLDFTWGENAYQLIYPQAIALAKQYSGA